MKRKSNVTKSNEETKSNNGSILTNNRGWLNPTKCTLRWLGLKPTRLNDGEKTHSLRMDDQAA